VSSSEFTFFILPKDELLQN